MSVYKVKGGFVISANDAWLPGLYESKKAANFAFSVPDSVKEELRVLAVGRGDGVISYQDIVNIKSK